jgi:hypothetical protein
MPNVQFKQSKQAIRNFMQLHYTDERLAQLLAHAQEGKLSFMSCCCFIAIPTANHALRQRGETGGHLLIARTLPGAIEAELAFMSLGQDTRRRRILIPMVRAEMRRRERVTLESSKLVTLDKEHAKQHRGTIIEDLHELVDAAMQR